MKAVDRTDSELAVLAFAYDSRTEGNVATEIVKYYLQMHYGIQKDYRITDLLQRGNFYQCELVQPGTMRPGDPRGRGSGPRGANERRWASSEPSQRGSATGLPAPSARPGARSTSSW